MAEEGVKPKKGFVETAAGWFGLLGVIAAAAAVVLVPAVVDPDLLATDPTKAYYRPELRMLLAASLVMLVAVAGVLVLGRRPVVVPVLVPALVLLGVSASSAFFSERPIRSLYGDRGEGLLSLAAEILLFYALARGLTSVSRVRLFLAAAVTAAALISVYGIAQNYGFDLISGWGNAPFTDLGRSFSTVGNPLTLASYLTLMMGASVVLYLGSASRAGRMTWLFALALIGACWIYAETRGALLGAGVALPVVLLVVRSRMGTVRPLMVPIAVLVAAMVVAVAVSTALGFSTLSIRTCAVLLAYLALVGAFMWLLDFGRARLALVVVLLVVLMGVGATAFAAASSDNLDLPKLGVPRDSPKAAQDGDVSLKTRLYAWRDTLPMILDRPLLGHGPDSFARSFRPYMSEELRDLITSREGVLLKLDRAHNDLLQVAATTGLLGLAAYLWVLASYFRNAYRYGGWAIAALSGAVLAYVLQLQTSFPSVATSVAFWGVLGASVALMRLPDHEGGEERSGDAGFYPSSEEPGKGRDEMPVATGAAMGSRRSRRRSRSPRRGELLVAVAIVGLLAAIAVPTFLEQREKFTRSERVESDIRLRLAAYRYERFLANSGTSPEAGVYVTARPIKNLNGRPLVRPPVGVTVTIETTPEEEFTMEWKKTTLVGTFVASYDSATGSYVAPS